MKRKWNNVLSRVISMLIICVLLITGMPQNSYAKVNGPTATGILKTEGEISEMGIQGAAEGITEGESTKSEARESEESADTDTAGTETTGTEASSTDTVGPEASSSDTSDTELPGTEIPEKDATDTEVAGTETTGTESGDTETAGDFNQEEDDILSTEDEDDILLLDDAADDDEGSSYPTNLVNGSFESADYHSDTSLTRMYKYAQAATITGWYTTATDNQIEIAWLSNRDKTGGDSQHMSTKSLIGGADGNQFIENVANQPGAVYQAFAVTEGESLTWHFSHRGRNEAADTVAMFIGSAPENLSSLDRTNASTNDIFYEMVSWMKTSGVTAPANGEAVTYTLYTTPVDSSTHQLSLQTVTDPISFTQDSDHTQQWKVTLFSSNNEKWNTASGTYTVDGGQTEAVMAFAPFYSAYKQSEAYKAGNLLDAISVTDGSGNERITEGSFENVNLGSSRYKTVSASNMSSPASGIGNWRTTSYDSGKRQIEVGVFDSTRNAYKLPEYKIYPYVRDGYQFAELNATQESTLYQYIQTEPGARYDWSLSHRGRTGVDTMALVIGPKQDYDPKKTSKSGRDQLMQIVDWLKSQTDVVIEDDGDDNCSRKLTVYTSKFNENGGFTTSFPFSWTEDAEHTEEWNVWIISSTNDDWYDYGAGDADADYNYSYYVPEEGGVALFSFVSYKSSPKTDGTVDMTFGNLLDNVQFDIYYHIHATSAPNGSGSYAHADNIGEIQEAEEIDFSSDNEYSGWALSDTAFRVVAKPGEKEFLGAVINGEFFPVSLWTYEADTGEYYYDVTAIRQHYDIRLIFAADHVIYDVNGGDEYHYDPDDLSTGYEVQLAAGRSPSYTSHAAESSKDGWRFTGWQYTDGNSNSYLFDGVHTVSYQADESDPEGKISIVDSTSDLRVTDIPAGEGVTLVAQWLYRQRFAAQIPDGDSGEYIFSQEGGSISTNMAHMTDTEQEDFLQLGEDGVSSPVPGGGEYYLPDDGRTVSLTATPSTGYRFAGWYDTEGNLVSNSRTYSYLLQDRLVNTLYARFEPEGYDLSVSKVIPEVYGTYTCYFGVDINLYGLRPDTSYKITNGTLTNMTTADGSSISANPTYVKAGPDGKAVVTIYLRAGQTTVFSDLPYGTGYMVIEKDYTACGYNSSGNVTTLTTMSSDQTVTITNTIRSTIDVGVRTETLWSYALVALLLPAVWLLCRRLFKNRRRWER